MRARVFRLLIALVLLNIQSASAQFMVTTGADSGPGSLRQAILDANRTGPCSPGGMLGIGFRVQPDGLPLRIELQSPLPPIRATLCGIGIGGGRSEDWPVAEIRGPGDGLRIHDSRNVRIEGIALRGFPDHGIVIRRSSGVTLFGLSISDNGKNGIVIADSETVSMWRSVIRGNGSNGIYATSSSELDFSNRYSANQVVANRANGIHLHDVRGARVGAEIRENALTGLLITGHTTATSLDRSTFDANGLLGIDIGGDGPSVETTPLIESAMFNRGLTRVAGLVRSTPNTRIAVTIYSNDEPDPIGFGEGAVIAREVEVTTNDSGEAPFVALISNSGSMPRYVTAIATSPSGISEFSRTVQVVAAEDPTFTVTTTRDSGPGSLRQAIDDVNALPVCHRGFLCVIAFQIAEEPSTEIGVHSIAVVSALPVITASRVLIVGATQRDFGGDTNLVGPEVEINGSRCEECNGLEFRSSSGSFEVSDLVVNGFAGDGIAVIGTTPSDRVFANIKGSHIGTDSTGGVAIGNARGVYLENVRANITGSIVSGNRGDGIAMDGGSVFVAGSRIGTDRTGFVPLANGGNGVRIVAERSFVYGNIIAFNKGRGVSITPTIGHHGVAENVIHSNFSLGIDIGHDGVTTTRALTGVDIPVIVAAHATGSETRITYRPQRPTKDVVSIRVDFFAASFTDATGYGEGRQMIGNSRVIAFDRIDQEHEVTIPLNLAGKFISAVTTKFGGLDGQDWASSEFSKAVQVTTDGCPSLAPMILSAVTEHGVTTVRWSPLPGATEYRIWVMAAGDEPRIAYRGTETQTTRSIAAGAEWWIEARFDPCYGTQSEHRFIPRVSP